MPRETVPLRRLFQRPANPRESAALPRLLYLTKIYPYSPVAAGDAVYSRGIIEGLAPECMLEVLCAESDVPIKHDPRIVWHCVKPPRRGRAGSVLSRWPLIAWKGATPSFRTALNDLLRRDWEVIVLDNLGLAHALPTAVSYRNARASTRLVYVSHEYEYPTRVGKYGSYRLGLMKRILATFDLAKVRRSEINLLRSCDIVTVINSADIEPFRSLAPGRKYLPLPPGYFGPVMPHRRIDETTPKRVLLLGGRRSEQKRQILIDWLEVCHSRFRRAGIEIVVAGDMEEGLKRLIADRYPQVQILGFVDDLAPLIASARMGLVVDTIGGGFKLRLLSHVFERLPIVGLSDAISGLPVAEGQGYMGAPTLHDLVDLVIRVIDDTEALDRLQNRAFSDCASKYAWSSRADDFLTACGDPHCTVLR